MKFINILGLLFQFISFWLAAPELLGETALKRLERQLVRFVSVLPNIILFGVILTVSLTLGINGLLKGLDAVESGTTQSDMIQYFVSLGIIMLLYMAFLLLYKRIRLWVELKLAKPFMQSIIDDNQIRFTLLKLAAALFTIGFLLQLIALTLTD